ncbi:hypothetical protein B0H14DRAFT_2380379, partial [Mycena olivaceomarginata]
ESEDEIRPGGKRGPESQTRDHFWPPAATNNKGDRRWSFVCRHCRASVTFKRKVDKTQLFGDEKPAPALGNLATHYKDHHQGVPVPADVPSGESRGISATSAKIMADFLVDGKLNPAINSSQKNFYKIFAAWIIEDDLPFTTGEDARHPAPFCFPPGTVPVAERYDRAQHLGADILRDNVRSKIAVSTNVTKQMSYSSTPTLPWVLPMYVGMLKHLRSAKDSTTLAACLRSAAAAGLTKLEFYFVKACDCHLNIISTCASFSRALSAPFVQCSDSAPPVARDRMVS